MAVVETPYERKFADWLRRQWRLPDREITKYVETLRELWGTWRIQRKKIEIEPFSIKDKVLQEYEKFVKDVLEGKIPADQIKDIKEFLKAIKIGVKEIPYEDIIQKLFADWLKKELKLSEAGATRYVNALRMLWDAWEKYRKEIEVEVPSIEADAYHAYKKFVEKVLKKEIPKDELKYIGEFLRAVKVKVEEIPKEREFAEYLKGKKIPPAAVGIYIRALKELAAEKGVSFLYKDRVMEETKRKALTLYREFLRKPAVPEREVAERVEMIVPFSIDFEDFLRARRLPKGRIERFLERLRAIARRWGWRYLLSGKAPTYADEEPLRLYREYLCSRYYHRLYPLLKEKFVRGEVPLEKEFTDYLRERKVSPTHISRYVHALRQIARKDLGLLIRGEGVTPSEREALGYYREFLCSHFERFEAVVRGVIEEAGFERWIEEDMKRVEIYRRARGEVIPRRELKRLI